MANLPLSIRVQTTLFASMCHAMLSQLAVWKQNIFFDVDIVVNNDTHGDSMITVIKVCRGFTLLRLSEWKHSFGGSINTHFNQEMRDLTNRMWFIALSGVIPTTTVYASSQWSKYFGLNRIFWPLWWRVLVVDKSTDNAKSHSICFLITIWASKSLFVFRGRAERGIARHTDASSVVWTLIDNGKLANQIARLVAIVVHVNAFRSFWSVKTKAWRDATWAEKWAECGMRNAECGMRVLWSTYIGGSQWG